MSNAAVMWILVLALLVACTVLATYLLAYAAHCFMVVLQETAAGGDEIIWPDEPAFDWLRRSAYLLTLAMLWIAPGAILWRALRRSLLPDDPMIRFAILVVPVFWLAFPFGLLSSLSCDLRWIPFRWEILVRLLRCLPATVAFYVSSAALFALTAAPWYFLFTTGQILLVVPAGVMTGASMLIYPRLLGRLGWRISRLGPQHAGNAVLQERQSPTARVQAVDMWPEPDDAEPLATMEKQTAIVADPKVKGPQPEKDSGANDKFAANDPGDESDSEPTFTLAPDEAAQRPTYAEMHTAWTGPKLPGDAPQRQSRAKAGKRRTSARPPPTSPSRSPNAAEGVSFITGVCLFPAYRHARMAWLRLSIGWTVLGSFVFLAVTLMEHVKE